MAIEIANLAAGLCSVNVPVPGATPTFWGPSGRSFATVNFALFAPSPAPAANSERVARGVYRMHMVQTFTFLGGQVGAIATLNAKTAQAATMASRVFPPGINATGVDLGSGTDIVVTVGGGPPNGPFTPEDGDFTLLVLQFPTQQTP